jgi:hypothetical protein
VPVLPGKSSVLEAGEILTTINDTTIAEVRGLISALALKHEVGSEVLGQWTEHHTAVVRSHMLGPWLYRALRSSPRMVVPEQILGPLHKDYLLSSLAAVAREDRFKSVLHCFQEHRIPVVILKGAFLGYVVYENPALRPMADIDILVGEDDYEKAHTLLLSLGYKQQVQALGSFHKELHPALAHVHKERSGDSVDLHRGLWFMDYYRLSPSAVWKHTERGRLSGKTVLYLSLELNFIHVALHHLTHKGSLRDWLDMVLLIQHPRFRWERLVSLCRDFRVIRPLHWIFKGLSRDWGIAVPRDVCDALQEQTPHWLEDPVIRSRFRYAWRFVSRVGFIEGWPSRLAYLRLSLLPSSEYRKAIVGTTAWLPYLKSKLDLFLHFAK